MTFSNEQDIQFIGEGGELSTSEEATVATIDGLGTANQVLATNAGVTAVEWQTIAGTGDVSKVGTPVDNQIGVWTGDGTIEGDVDVTYDGTDMLLGATAATTKLQFRDSAVFINSATDGHLDLDADISIDLNAAIVVGTNDITLTGAIGRDTDNEINWGTDDSLAIAIGGVTHNIVSISDGAGDNDKLATQGYVDDTAGGGGGASTALDNLASVAINTALISDTYNTDDLGSSEKAWRDLYLGNTSVIDWSTAASTSDMTLTHAANSLTFAGGVVALGTATATGGITANVTGNVTGDITGNAGTVSTITGLAPDTATTQATQASITTTANLTTVGALDAGSITANFGTINNGASDILTTGSLGATGSRLTKGWFTDLQVTNAIAGDITGNAATVTNAILTTALTVDTGTVTLTGHADNDSVLTIGKGAVSVDGTNTGDNTVCTSGTATTAATLATTRAIYGNNFDGSAALTQVIASTYGGTGNGFTKFTGATTAEKTYTLPDSSVTILYSGGDAGTPSALVGTNISGTAANLTAGTVSTIAGLAPDTATTQATQAAITSVGTLTGIVTSGDIDMANTKSIGIADNELITFSSAGTITIAGATLVTSGNLELGHATDTTISRSAAGVIAVEGVVIPSISSTNTLTNKRITDRVWTAASDATPDVNSDDYDAVTITALAAAITDVNMSGTPTNFQKLIFRIKDNGTARAITWGSDFEDAGVALPTTTVISKLLTVGFIYNSVSGKWGCVASVSQT